MGERALLGLALALLAALSWLYLARMPMAPAQVGGVAGRVLATLPPRFAELWLTFSMWTVMMVAMMVPSAAPMVMTYARIARGRQGGRPRVSVWAFVAGYLAIWTAFSAAATALQTLLAGYAWLSGALVARPLIGAAILLCAGLYQLTPLKEACLGRCQSPLGFLMTHWRTGVAGAFRMGLAHGADCVGCCWLLMALLFVAGVMNLVWVAAISALVVLEKTTPLGRAIANLSGIALLIAAAVYALPR